MDPEQILLLSIAVCGASLLFLPKPRRWWVRPWLCRRDKGNLHPLKEELEEDRDSFKNFLRMNEETFEWLLTRVKPQIEKQDTKYRDSISARDRLIITLRYLATGESMKSLRYSFRVGHSTISKIIHDVCPAIYACLKDEYLRVPCNADEWLNIAKGFEDKWQFPNALGAIDGKHILLQPPSNAGSTFYNCKGGHSIVLLAVVDANYKFLYVDVGTNERISDGGVFHKCSLFRAMASNKLNFPEEKPLPGEITPMPHVIIGDAAFPLMKNILKPFPFRNMSWDQRIFNYRLSRARRVVENAFGILANRF